MISEETRLRKSESMKRYWASVSNEVRASHTRELNNPETFLKRQATLRSRYQNEPGFREKRLQITDLLQSPDIRERAAESLRKRWESDGDRLREAIVVPLHSPEVEEKRLAAMKRFEEKPGYKEFRAEIVRRPEVREKISKTLTGKKASRETREKRSESMKITLGKLTEEEARERLLKRIRANHRRPTKPELIIQQFLDAVYPNQWLYNGGANAGTAIGGKIPDFVNINRCKAVIECFGDYWHDPLEFPDALTDEQLTAHYKEFGFNCLILWESEVYNKRQLGTKILAFVRLCEGSK